MCSFLCRHTHTHACMPLNVCICKRLKTLLLLCDIYYRTQFWKEDNGIFWMKHAWNKKQMMLSEDVIYKKLDVSVQKLLLCVTFISTFVLEGKMCLNTGVKCELYCVIEGSG